MHTHQKENGNKAKFITPQIVVFKVEFEKGFSTSMRIAKNTKNQLPEDFWF